MKSMLPQEDYYVILSDYASPLEREFIGELRRLISDAILYGKASGKPVRNSNITGIFATTNSPEGFLRLIEETTQLRDWVKVVHRDELIIYPEAEELIELEVTDDSLMVFRSKSSIIEVPMDKIGFLVLFKVESTTEESYRELKERHSALFSIEDRMLNRRDPFARMEVIESKRMRTEFHLSLLLGAIHPIKALLMSSKNFRYVPQPEIGLKAPLVRDERIKFFVDYVINVIGIKHLDPGVKEGFTPTTDLSTALLRLNWLTYLARERARKRAS